MQTFIKQSIALATLAVAAQAQAQVTLYDGEDFQGRSFTTRSAVPDLSSRSFNDRGSSVVVEGGPWQVCEDAGYRGRCVVLQAGRYSSLASTGITNRVSSLRSMEISASNQRRPQPDPDGITFYEGEGFSGRSFSVTDALPNFQGTGMNDRVSSARVSGGDWQVCSDAQYGGNCTVLRAGQYPSLGTMGMNDRLSSARQLNQPARPPVAVLPSVTFYAQENYRGRSFTTQDDVLNLERQGVNRRVASASVAAGHWEVCEEIRFGGRCMVLQAGRYPTLASMGLAARIGSVRVNHQDLDFSTAGNRPRDRDQPLPAYDSRRRNGERYYQAEVTSVREVRGTADQRCWVDREPVAATGNKNVPAGIAGALIGGILGHQVGGGTGKDLATVGGAIAGAMVGANIGRGNGEELSTQEVQRCNQASGQGRASYWEVSYNFRGTEHRVQMSSPPAATVTVNEQGEPRV